MSYQNKKKYQELEPGKEISFQEKEDPSCLITKYSENKTKKKELVLKLVIER